MMRIVVESSMHAYVGVGSPSQADVIVHGRVRSHPYTFMHLLRCAEVVFPEELLEFGVLVQESRGLPCMKIATFDKLCGKRRSPAVDLSWQTDHSTLLGFRR